MPAGAQTGSPRRPELSPSAEELHGLGDDLDGLSLGAVLGLPFAPFQSPVDRHRASLGEILRAVLALVAPDGDVEIVRLLSPLAGPAVLSARVDGEPQAANGGAARGMPEFGVSGQVADEHDAIDVGHSLSSSRG